MAPTTEGSSSLQAEPGTGAAGKPAPRTPVEEALRASHERFELAMAGANDGLWDWDLTTDACYYSPRYKKMLGYADDEVGSDIHAFERLLHPDDHARVFGLLNEYLAGRLRQFEGEVRLRHKDGHYIEVIGRAALALGPDGAPARLVGTNLDVTQQNALRRRLAIQYAATRALVPPDTTSALLIRTLTAVCEASDWDVACVRQVNAAGDRLEGLCLWQSPNRTPHDWSPRLEGASFARGEGLPGAAWAAGTPAWVVRPAAQATPPHDELPPGMQTACIVPVGVGSDVVGVFEYYSAEIRHRDPELLAVFDSVNTQIAEAVERYRINQDLQRAEQRYRHIVEHSVIGIYQTTLDGRFLGVNPAFAFHTGYGSSEQLLASGVNAQSLYVDAGRRAEFIRALTEKGAVLGFEVRVRRKDGSILWAANYAQLVRDDPERPPYIEGFVEDISEQKEAEQLKSDFVSFVSHQLRTPLAGIRWLLELADSPAVPEEERSYVRDAHISTDWLIHLVNDLLNVSRFEGGGLAVKLEALDLRSLTDDAVAELTPIVTDNHLHVRLTSPPGLPAVAADRQLGQEVIGNLLSNAFRYTPDGGHVSIEIGCSRDVVEWTVRDDGIGIPAAARPHIFEKFFRAENASTSHTDGTGLGLYIVRLIVDRLGGRVWCDSEEGVGSTFGFSLPVAPQELAP